MVQFAALRNPLVCCLQLEETVAAQTTVEFGGCTQKKSINDWYMHLFIITHVASSYLAQIVSGLIVTVMLPCARRRQGQPEQPSAPLPGGAALCQHQLQEELDGDLIPRRMLPPPRPPRLVGCST